jgi:2-hydroxy-3-oxopropionate reductase
MARNLARAGHTVTAWNRSFDKAESLSDAGVIPVRSIQAAVTAAEVVVVMLSSGPVCDEVLFGAPDPAVEALEPGSTVILMSSIPVETARSQAEKLAKSGVRYLDAPVSGGEKGAIEATLTIMVGGEANDLERVEPVLRLLGRVTHVGPVGCGQLAKLANQLIVGVTIGAVAEALALVAAGGGDAAAVRSALLGGFADSTILRQHGERMLKGDFKPGAKSTVQLKDLRTVLDLASTLALHLPLADTASAQFERLCQSGGGDLDHAAVYTLVLPDTADTAARP